MVFPSIPAYFDPSSSQQQQPNPQTGGGTGGNPHLLLPPPPPPPPPPPAQTHAGSGGPGSGSIIPGSMAAVKCPRCDSTNTKFFYFNNYSLAQPRYFCKTCRRYWTRCDALRNVPVGGGCRRNKRSKGSSSSKSPVSSGDRQTSSGGSSSAISSNSTGTASLGAEQGIRQTHNPSQSSLISLIRSLNQFEVNETLFGVKSTFDEEIHTTKLEEGPQMRELEREASRIAGKIEGEETQDLHLTEERGIHLHEKFDIDEETRFSLVFRGVDDSGYDEDEDALLDSCNIETFGGASGSVVGRALANLTSGKSNDGAPMSSCSSSMDEIQSSLSNTARDVHCSDFNDHSGQLSSESLSKSSALDSESRIQENQFSAQHAGNNYVKEFVEKQMLAEEAQTSKSEDLQPSLRAKKDGSDGGLSANATSYTSTSLGSSKDQEKMSSPSGLTEDAAPVKPQGATESARSHGRPGSSASERGGAASASSAQVLSPSSSMSSLSSEKSTLNPHAKEMPYKGREF